MCLQPVCVHLQCPVLVVDADVALVYLVVAVRDAGYEDGHQHHGHRRGELALDVAAGGSAHCLQVRHGAGPPAAAALLSLLGEAGAVVGAGQEILDTGEMLHGSSTIHN